jgi:hypothetical protein
MIAHKGAPEPIGKDRFAPLGMALAFPYGARRGREQIPRAKKIAPVPRKG